jgi:hypothetical protein
MRMEYSLIMRNNVLSAQLMADCKTPKQKAHANK